MTRGAKGVDISEMNGAFDLSAAKKQGAEFVIVRCGYGGDYKNQDDGRYVENLRKCEEAGMPYGVYLYSYALTAGQVESEARHALRLLGHVGSFFRLGMWFDMEDADGYKKRNGMPDDKALRDICDAFCGAVKSAGYDTGIYAPASWLKNRLNGPQLAAWPKWVAHWAVAAPGYTHNMVLWQYQSPPGDVASPTAYDWNLAYADFTKGSDHLSRVLQEGENQITQGYKAGSHDGVDLVKKQDELDTIIAHSPGTVVMVQTGHGNAPGSTGNASYGNLVKIRHENGYYTLYAHLESVSVKSGVAVSKGQAIGYMGNTGNSYGAHLHFEVRGASDSRIDPTPYINADLPGLETEEDMTKAEVQALIDSAVKPLQAELTRAGTELAALAKTYAYIEDVPEWYREGVQYYVDEGLVRGKGIKDGKPFLDLTATECRMITLMYREQTEGTK